MEWWLPKLLPCQTRNQNLEIFIFLSVSFKCGKLKKWWWTRRGSSTILLTKATSVILTFVPPTPPPCQCIFFSLSEWDYTVWLSMIIRSSNPKLNWMSSSLNFSYVVWIISASTFTYHTRTWELSLSSLASAHTLKSWQLHFLSIFGCLFLSLLLPLFRVKAFIDLSLNYAIIEPVSSIISLNSVQMSLRWYI